jgi:hypothetical protein
MNDMESVVKQLQNQKADIEAQLSKVNAAVAALKGLGNKNGSGAASGRAPRIMSASARRRIAAAQKARWAKWRRAQKAS